tara:strand:+ start:250 stop:471 length:222 start_codon:yes stop_codon:yes gene_type:complete
MSFNIIKIFKNEVTGKKSSVFLLDGLSSILEIKSKEEALKIVEQCNLNSEGGWRYEVRLRGEKIKQEITLETN